METLRAHFRRLTMVQTEARKRLLFRFYDPRVLLPFVMTCDAPQLLELFGPVERFIVEAAQPDTMKALHLASGRIEIVKRTLTDRHTASNRP